MPIRTALMLLPLAVTLLSPGARPVDRRVVDTVEAGNADSEALHGYVGDRAVAGVENGKPVRQALGWMRYALKAFDDTEVTVACTFVGRRSVAERYDIVVEDSLISTRVVPPDSVGPVVVEVAVPFAVTRGRTNLAVIVRARGGMTPALRELRIIQDHNEVDLLQNPSGVAR